MTFEDWENAASPFITTDNKIKSSELSSVLSCENKEKIMNKNYYVYLANMLGVELGEYFYIDNNKSFPYKISEDGLYGINGADSHDVKVSLDVLQPVFDGKSKIVRHGLWRPKYGETYFLTDLWNGNLFTEHVWEDTEDEHMFYDCGLIFKTEEEAIKFSHWMLDKIADE